MIKPRAWVGIDPGKSGALAHIDEYGGQAVVDYSDVSTMAGWLQYWLEDLDIKLAVIESVHSFPHQGVRSMFTFGCNFGEWRGLLTAMEISFVEVRPTVWRRGLVPPKADKEQIRSIARKLFPLAELSRKKDHGRAEALLLAYYSKQQWNGEKQGNAPA